MEIPQHFAFGGSQLSPVVIAPLAFLLPTWTWVIRNHPVWVLCCSSWIGKALSLPVRDVFLMTPLYFLLSSWILGATLVPSSSYEETTVVLRECGFKITGLLALLGSNTI